MAKLILIAGVSRSGKTTLANKLAADLPNSIVLHQDEFILAESQLPRVKERIDWEKPETVNWEALMNRVTFCEEDYDYIFLEGIFALCHSDLLEKADCTVLLNLSFNEFNSRRKEEKRWGKEPPWFIDHVWQSHLKYHNPYKAVLSYQFVSPTPVEYLQLLDQLKS